MASCVHAVVICQVGRRVSVPVAENLRPRWPRSNLPPARECPGRRKPAAKMAARQICPKAQRVGRARSPLRAGVGSVLTRRLGRNPTVRALTGAATESVGTHGLMRPHFYREDAELR